MDGPGPATGWRLHSCGAAPSQMWAAGARLRGAPPPEPTSTSWARNQHSGACTDLHAGLGARNRVPPWHQPGENLGLLLWEPECGERRAVAKLEMS